jgi:glycerol-3-phosphate dehydrogenase (NAD+)
MSHGKHRVVVVGGGAWGTTIAKLCGERCAADPERYIATVKLWMTDATLPSGKTLSQTINEQHENPTYLPGVRLPDNVVAEPDLMKAAHQATLVIFAVPAQWIYRGLFVRILTAPCAPACRFLSLVKGLSFSNKMASEQSAGAMGNLTPSLVSQQIRHETNGASVSVLMGANVATEVANDQFCEATIGARSNEDGETWFHLLNRPNLRVNVVLDVEGVEACGGLKNLVALGAGFCDGLKLGSNTKAAVVRIGLEEVRRWP